MALSCTVCRHPQISEINVEILEGVGTKAIVEHFNSIQYPVSTASLTHHRTAGHASRDLTRQVLMVDRTGVLSEFARIQIASKVVRVQKLQDTLERIEQVFAERAEAYPHLPGGSTGFVGLKRRMIGSGLAAVEVEESFFDKELVSEYRAVLEQAAKECGEWRPDGGEKAEALNNHARSIVIHAAVSAKKLEQPALEGKVMKIEEIEE